MVHYVECHFFSKKGGVKKVSKARMMRRQKKG